MAKKNIVIVESPAKAKTIEKFLGKTFHVTASYGHVRDLPAKKLGVDLKNNFEPTYSNLKDKAKVIAEMKSLCKTADEIYIATDPDREGEAIAWHITNALKLKIDYKRIVFNEITETAIKAAISESREIDIALVDAQQARRILDRLIGYKLSPILSKKIRKGLSAGRVQSVAVKIICDREKEILAFITEEYWIIDVLLEQEKRDFQVVLFAKDDVKKKLEIPNEKEAIEHVEALKKATYSIEHIKKTKVNRNAPSPFITSTLQQEASRKLNWTAKRTMIVAQQLYEGLNIGGEHVGLITYMRTDSIRISDEAKDASILQITNDYGKEYLTNKKPVKKKKTGVQDAHEAIRPSYVDKKPSDLKGILKEEQFKLYQLIWNRFLASQMANQIVEQTQLVIKGASTSDYFLKTTGQVVLFDGFTRVYEESKDTKKETDPNKKMPALSDEKAINFKDITPNQKFTQPPARFTEASLVKELEEQGIGRPSTYAPTLGTVQDRGYVEKEGKALKPSELGMTVNNQLEKFFKNVIDVKFTSEMETQFDEIMDGKHDWQNVISKFYGPFSEMVKDASENMEVLKKVIETDEKCEKCESMMVIKEGRFGNFMACSDFPKCKNTKSLAEDLGVNCPQCNEKLGEKRSRRGKIFYGCSGFPACKFALWDKPIKEDCPTCKAPYMCEKTKKGGDIITYCHECKPKPEKNT